MRKIFKLTLVALALLALTACEKEPASVHDGERYPILFGNYETRATADLDDLKEYGFKVYAYFEGNTGNSHTFVKEVTYSSAQDVWGYEGLEYWIPGARYWFKAFYPTIPSAGTLTVDNTSSTQPFKITDFDISKQEDIMVATAEREVANGAKFPTSGSSVVDLTFQHLLACVVVKIKAEVNVTINNVSLKYVPVNGSYANGLWSYSSQGNIEKDGLNKSLSSSSNEYHDVTDGGFLVFPCGVNGTKLYIKTSDKTYELPLTAPTSWVAGNRYSYTLTIKQNDILFDEPSVEEWDEENATGSVVIK